MATAPKSIKHWLTEMGEWNRESLEQAAMDYDGPSNKRTAALRRLQMESTAVSKTGVPLAAEAFEAVADRVEGRPAGGDGTFNNYGPVLAIGTEALLGRITEYLAGADRRPFSLGAPVAQPSDAADVRPSGP